MTSTREEANITHLLCRGRTGKSSQNLRTGGCAPAYGCPINSRGKRGTEGRSSQDQTRKRLRQSRRGCWEAPNGQPRASRRLESVQRAAALCLPPPPSSVLSPGAACSLPSSYALVPMPTTVASKSTQCMYCASVFEGAPERPSDGKDHARSRPRTMRRTRPVHGGTAVMQRI